LDRVNKERDSEMAQLLDMLSPAQLERAEDLVDIITELAEVYGNWKEPKSDS